MGVFLNYCVDKDIYHNPGTPHCVTLSTTQYTYKSELLVHLSLGKNLGIIINNLIQYEFGEDEVFESEQFLLKKTHDTGRSKPMTQSIFEDKLKRFDMSQTVKEQEVLEEYRYIDKNGQSDMVRIVVTVKGGSMTAVIDFKDTEQYKNFIKPAWLMQPAE